MLRERGLDSLLVERAGAGVPLLGACLVPAFAHAREYALHPYELDARKRLEIWIELPGESAPAPCAETVNALLAALAAVNQDFRESLRMLDAESRPSVKLFARGQSPMSAQDARIKKKYIV